MTKPTAFLIQGGSDIEISGNCVQGYDQVLHVTGGTGIKLRRNTFASTTAVELTLRAQYGIPDSISDRDLKKAANALAQESARSGYLKKVRTWVESQSGVEWATFALELLKLRSGSA